ncbi:MAG: type II toxin-antitoxin system VapC family toxin [bacterium]|nr:type II toxin-antitoxin system VapC family toxin [bacterium]
MKKSVYIETSVISYYTARTSRDLVTAGRQQITQEWWEDIRLQFDSYISVLVLREAGSGDEVEAEKRLRAISEMPVLKLNDEAENLANELIGRGKIPKECPEDALHIALAAVHGMDFLLTWNFKHINNAQIKSGVIKIVQNIGYECPVLCSPEELEGDFS